jgi:CubicO group peptidase (beta-lactamase class C family)
MQNFKPTHRVLLITSILILFSACLPEDLDIKPAFPTFDIDLFEQNIIDAVSDKAPGYAYCINQDQLLYSKGAGGFADVGNQIPFENDFRMQIASVSKPITAVAVLNLLEDLPDVHEGSPIYPYLPSRWKLGPNMQNLTFENLLTHKTGLIVPGYPHDFATLKDMVEGGLNEGQRGNTYKYDNSNFALCRILIPILAEKVTPEQANVGNGQLAAMFIDYVNDEIFGKANLDEAFCKPMADAKIKYYNCATNQINNAGDHSDRCGAYGWHLSAFDLGAFMAHVRYDGNILNPETRDLMDQKRLGWQPQAKASEHSEYRHHSGQWHYGDQDAGGMRSIIIKFDDLKVEASLLVNCTDHPEINMSSIMVNAFDNAWN